MKKKTQSAEQPGRFGPYGGMFVPEILMEPLRELEREWRAAARDPLFRRELDTQQIYFAMGEALAHLHFLRDEGKLSRELHADGVFRFVKASS